MNINGMLAYRLEGIDYAIRHQGYASPYFFGKEVLAGVEDIKRRQIRNVVKRIKTFPRLKAYEKPTPGDTVVMDRLVKELGLYKPGMYNQSWHSILRKVGTLKKAFRIGVMLDLSSDFDGTREDPWPYGWGYVLNFDENQLEVYRGNPPKNKDCAPGRYATPNFDVGGYNGLAFLGAFVLNDLPKDNLSLALGLKSGSNYE